MPRPIVLLPPDLDVHVGARGPVPRCLVQRAYVDAVAAAGGLPLLTPPLTGAIDGDALDDALDQAVGLADALVIAGGAFDIDPSLYGEERLPACGESKPERTALELALLTRAERKGIPILGVCGGMQLMNVARGGTLWQDLDSQVGTAVPHQKPGPKAEAAHDVVVEAGTRLFRAVERASLPVNSTHHQAIKALGRDLVVTARAPDGIVEAFEDPALPFFVGVQWHPESMPVPAQQAVYAALIHAAMR
jgi:putative glutamine amidotransferase